MHRPRPGSPGWEALCRRCGRCCHEKLELAGRIYYTDIPCEHLDAQTRLCAVYAERDVRRPGCVRLDARLLRRGFLPADCPYVAGLAGYRAPEAWPENAAAPLTLDLSAPLEEE